MEYRVFYDGISFKNKRPTNMDAVRMSVKEIGQEKVYFFLVCDGVGGTEGGAEAAQFISQELCEWFFSLVTTRHIGTNLSHVIFALNQELQEELGETIGATTLSTLLITETHGYFCHVGDSRIYESDKNLSDPWIQRSKDHVTPEGKLIDYLGKPQHLTVDSWELKISPSQFLLCTDGFYRRLDWDFAAPYLGTATQFTTRKKLEELALQVISKGEEDNCSALLVTIQE